MYSLNEVMSVLKSSKLSDTAQLKIIYLFMKADGECSREELQKFNEICQSKKITDEEKRSVVGYCECLGLERDVDNSYYVIKEIENILGKDYSSSPREGIDKIAEAYLVWTLLNLAYADADFSEPERKVIDFVIDYFKMDEQLMEEFNDTIQTILRLTEQIDWIKTTNKQYDIVHKSITEYENNIKNLFHNIEVSILEVNI